MRKEYTAAIRHETDVSIALTGREPADNRGAGYQVSVLD
jgi:hypothetical protein